MNMLKILVVDNQKTFVKFMSAVLEKQGHTVLTAKDGISALNILEMRIPDVIFIDLVMPNINGRQLARIIRSKPQFGRTKLVILSGIGAEEKENFLTSDIDAFIAKGPFGETADNVLSVLEKLESSSERATSPVIEAGLAGIRSRAVINELLAENRHFELILATMQEGVLLLNTDCKIIYANDAAATIFDQSETDLLGSDFLQLFEPPHRESVKDLLVGSDSLLPAFTKESPIPYNGKLLAMDLTPVKGSNQPSVIVVLNDITWQKQTKNALRQSEGMYRTVLEASPDPIVMYDMEGTVTYFNPAFEAVFGWPLSDCAGGKMDQFVPEENWPETEMMINKVLAGEQFSGIETYRYTRQGKMIPVSISGAIYRDHRGELQGSVVTLRDISKYKKLQSQLQHAQKMESIGTITSGVAHNFRNILTGISVNSQLLQMKFGDIPDLMKIETKTSGYVERGSQLISELMQFSQRQPKTLNRIDLTDVIDETFKLIRKSFDRKIEILLDVPEPLFIMGDPAGLSQVFFNLSTNARDAMPQGGKIFVKAVKKRGSAVVTVSDTGMGMDARTRGKCFDPFFTTKSVDLGTGLGLSTTYGIIKDHGGDIRVSSKPGAGTHFTILLNMAEKPEDEKTKEEVDVFPGRNERILIVDDEIDMLESMEELLTGIGFQAASALNCRDALIQYQGFKPDIVLLDRNMPDTDGIGTAEKIRELDPGARIIMMSGYDSTGPDGIGHDGMMLINGYLTKPIDIGALSRMLRQVLDEP